MGDDLAHAYNRRNDGIDVFKAILILSVVFAHIYVRYSKFLTLYFLGKIGNGAISVSSFFVIGGFLATAYNKTPKPYHVFDGVKHMWKHLKPLYIVYLLSCFSFINDNIRTNGMKYLTGNILEIIKNILMIYNWNISGKGSSFEISGVAWYLSCMTLFWLLTPMLRRVFYLMGNKASLSVFILLLLGLFFLYDQYAFLGYLSTVVRLIQYMIGMIVGLVVNCKIVNRYYRQCGVIGVSLFLMAFFNMLVFGTLSVSTLATCLAMVFLYHIDWHYEEKNIKWVNIFITIGRASGYIYLLHYPAVQLGCNKLYFELPQTHLTYLLQIIVLSIVSVLIPVMLYKISVSKRIFENNGL